MRNGVVTLPGWELWGETYRSPVMIASGVGGYGLELGAGGFLEDVAMLVSKATTPLPRKGNRPPRVVETRFGLLNSIGLANPGVEEVASRILPEAASLPCPLLVNVAGDSPGDFASVVSRLEDSPVPLGYELNVSCPNVSAGGMAFGADPEMVRLVTARVREVTARRFSVKLTPNEGRMTESARAAAEAGADAVTVCNTFLGMRVDWRTGRPALARGAGGYSSPALLPLTVARVSAVSRAAGIPVLASGGVGRGEDVLELLAAGAAMVQVGTLVMRRPGAASELMAEILGMLADR